MRRGRGCPGTVHYDPLLAKVITSGESRAAAIGRIVQALDRLQVEGIATVIRFQRHVMATDAFRSGRLHTQMVEQGAFHGA